jgi:fructose-1,6-bisphosphatase/inositol monophosphatase family enzyme
MPIKITQDPGDPPPFWDSERELFFEAAIRDLGAQLANATRRAVRSAAHSTGSNAFESLNRAASEGVGDTTFGLDEEPERIVAEWAKSLARTAPLSVLTEDTGWRHFGPTASGDLLDGGFDHGGPRIAIDPVDGTRNLMFDIRSAWASIALAPPGGGAPKLSDVSLGYLRELPDSRAAEARILVGRPRTSECTVERVQLDSSPQGVLLQSLRLATDTDARASGGFFPFFRYHPDMREELAHIEANFFERLETHEGANLREVYDDQYISNAGQLVLLAQAKYRMIADLRAFVAARRGRPSVTSKPYDVAAAIPIARAAGAIVTTPMGEELDFELDALTPVSFVGWANRETANRLAPHLKACLL